MSALHDDRWVVVLLLLVLFALWLLSPSRER